MPGGGPFRSPPFRPSNQAKVLYDSPLLSQETVKSAIVVNFASQWIRGKIDTQEGQRIDGFSKAGEE